VDAGASLSTGRRIRGDLAPEGCTLDAMTLVRDPSGLYVRRNQPRGSRALDRRRDAGLLQSILPGVYADAGVEITLAWRVRALMLWSADAILTREIAAAVSFWPALKVDVVSAADRCRGTAVGFAFERRTVPHDLVCKAAGLRFTSPALTAMDLCVADDGGAIDEVLRTRATTLAELRVALTRCPGRRGNPERQRLLLDSRDEPWSAAERCAHRLLRKEGITGWFSNYRIRAGARTYFLDIAFPVDRVAVEIDGRLFHDDPLVFESDRHRQNIVTLAGWTVLRFTWRMLQDAPNDVVATVRQALRRARRRSISA
jgi:very-short-patch-repair endonuclease